MDLRDVGLQYGDTSGQGFQEIHGDSLGPNS